MELSESFKKRLSKVEFYKNLNEKVRARVDRLLSKQFENDDVRSNIE